MTDRVNHPSHYTAHPSKIECIEITEHLSFCMGNALKYLWRCSLKGALVEDLEKAAWYLRRCQGKRSYPAATFAVREFCRVASTYEKTGPLRSFLRLLAAARSEDRIAGIVLPEVEEAIWQVATRAKS